MILKIKVIPNTEKQRIKKEEDFLKAYLTSPPIQGKANKELIKLFADYFNVSNKKVRIIKGEKSRKKMVEIL